MANQIKILKKERHSAFDLRWWDVVNLGAWVVFFLAFWGQAYIWVEGSVWAKSLGTWADGAAHLTYITAMSERLPVELPVYSGVGFIYPFVADLLSAILVRVGLSPITAYSIIGAILSVITVGSLYYFYRLILPGRYLALLSLNLFLLSGGLGFVKFFQDLYKNGWTTLTAIPQEYTLIAEWQIRWINIITGELIPQRALLLAIPVGLGVLIGLWRLINYQQLTWWQTAMMGLAVGGMPLIHAHTYIVLAGLSGFLWLSQLLIFSIKREFWSSWFIYGGLALAVSLPIIGWHILPATDASFLNWYPGWLARTAQVNWLWWWFVNSGVFFPLAIIGWLRFNYRLKQFTVGFWLVFIVANLWLFQPYDWDNSKLLTWSWLGLAPAVAVALESLWQGRWLRPLVVGLTLSLLLTGFIDVLRQLQPHVSIPMYSVEDLELVEWIKAETDPESIFLTGQSHVHPVSSLSGRQIVLGYQGWLWSYGIDYLAREADVVRLYQTGDSELMSRYGIDYVVVGPDERWRFRPSSNTFGHLPLAKETDNYQIYRVTEK